MAAPRAGSCSIHQCPRSCSSANDAPAAPAAARAPSAARNGSSEGSTTSPGSVDVAERRSPLAAHVHGRPVEIEDASDHDLVGPADQGDGPVVGDAEHLERRRPLLEGERKLLFEERFTLTRCLPDLGEGVPLEVLSADAGRVAHPRAHELGTGAHHPDHERTAPVVAHEVDRTLVGEALQLAHEPGDVVLLGGAEPLGSGGAESGKRQGHDVVAPELVAQVVPDRCRLRNPVDEDDGHRRSLPAPGPTLNTNRPEGSGPTAPRPEAPDGTAPRGARRHRAPRRPTAPRPEAPDGTAPRGARRHRAPRRPTAPRPEAPDGTAPRGARRHRAPRRPTAPRPEAPDGTAPRGARRHRAPRRPTAPRPGE